MRQTADNIFAAYQNIEEDGQFYTDHTLYTIIKQNADDGRSLKYFLGLLNSKLLNYVYQLLSMQEGKILAQARTSLVEELPVIYESKYEKKLVQVVDEIIYARRNQHGCDISALEEKLDSLVCDIYELTTDEKRIIFYYAARALVIMNPPVHTVRIAFAVCFLFILWQKHSQYQWFKSDL
jgi:hypothetical protein